MGKNYHQTFHTKIKNLHSGEVTLTFFLQADFSCSLFSNVLGKPSSCKATLKIILHCGEALKSCIVGKILVVIKHSEKNFVNQYSEGDFREFLTMYDFVKK